ncbi:MAG: S24/S26 family peptidase [Clostridia bacterium]|nr:S24/S26 family peptidase [Clostridia bacterium]
MSSLSPVLQEILAAGTSVEITVSGNSMYPMLKHQISRVRLSAAADLRIGDLPLYRRENGAYVLHRIVGRKNGSYICCGDNQWHLERDIRREQMIAVVTDYCRDGKWRSCAARSYRLYARFWIAIRPFRRILIGGGRRLWRLIHKNGR